MEIYLININKCKYKQYKTYDESLIQMNKLILTNPNIDIEIILEEYCDDNYSDSGCKTQLLCEYKNSVFLQRIQF